MAFVRRLKPAASPPTAGGAGCARSEKILVRWARRFRAMHFQPGKRPTGARISRRAREREPGSNVRTLVRRLKPAASPAYGAGRRGLRPLGKIFSSLGRGAFARRRRGRCKTEIKRLPSDKLPTRSTRRQPRGSAKRGPTSVRWR